MLKTWSLLAQRDTITHEACSASLVLAASRIIDPVAIADIEAASAAVPQAAQTQAASIKASLTMLA